MSEGLLLGPFRESEVTDVGRRLGVWLAEQQRGVFIGLRGGLGAGKSVLARAIAAGAGIRDTMPSPTFNLVFRYATSMQQTVAHLDLYRLNHPAEVWELGWEELSGGDEIALVEWPERAAALLPPDRWEIALMPVANGSRRLMSVQMHGRPPAFPTDHLVGIPPDRRHE